MIFFYLWWAATYLLYLHPSSMETPGAPTLPRIRPMDVVVMSVRTVLYRVRHGDTIPPNPSRASKILIPSNGDTVAGIVG